MSRKEQGDEADNNLRSGMDFGRNSGIGWNYCYRKINSFMVFHISGTNPL